MSDNTDQTTGSPTVPDGPIIKWGKVTSTLMGTAGFGPSMYGAVVSAIVLFHVIAALVAMWLLSGVETLIAGGALIVLGLVTGARYAHYLDRRHAALVYELEQADVEVHKI